MNGRPSVDEQVAAPGTSRKFARDAIELGELQFDLLVADSRAAAKAARTGSVLVLIAAGLLFAAAPVLLLAIASWLESVLDISEALSLLITAGATILLCAVLLIAGWLIVKNGTAKFQRSRAEFRQNLAWLKQTLAPGETNTTP